MIVLLIAFISQSLPIYKANAIDDKYVVITASSCTESGVQEALDEAKEYATAKNPYYIKVPKGKYTMLYGNHIYSNTTLDLTGVTIKNPCERSGAILQVGYPRREGGEKGYKLGKYKRGKNIKIIGGTLDGGSKAGIVSSLVTFSHVKNISFYKTTFKFKPKTTDDAHSIEFGAAKNVTINKCKFLGNHNVSEALQIESAVSGVAHSDLMGKTDGTKTKDVVISNCVFNGYVYGLGTNHGCDKDIYSNIVIKNNSFKNISKYCICTYNYQAKITNNKASNCSNMTRIFKLGSKNSISEKGNNW